VRLSLGQRREVLHQRLFASLHRETAARAHPPAGAAVLVRRLRTVTGNGLVVPAIGLITGTGLLCLAYSVAATQPPGQLEFVLFWLGELAGVVPLACRLTLAQASRSERLALVTAAGLFAFIPKFLRDPTSPLFYDEVIHWHEAQLIFQVGHPFVTSSLLPIIRFYPGLEELTASVQNLTGLSTFEVATILMWLVHVLALVGVFVLVERITRSSRAAGLAAIFYSVGPAFMFFDAQFSYESLAIVFAVWVLTCLVGLQTAVASGRPGRTWIVLASVLAAGCIVTHHVTTYALAVALLALTIALVPRRGFRACAHRGAPAGTWIFTAMFAAGASAWLVFVAPATLAYLGPHILPAITDALSLLTRTNASRHLFAGSTVPGYERAAAFATPVLLAALAAAAWITVRRHGKLSPSILGLGLFGMLYFASLPVMLTSQVEGAVRSWADSYIGLAVLIAALASVVLPRFDSTAARRFGAAAIVSAVLVVILVGNVTVQVDVAYRFPGPDLYSSDTRSLTPELLAAASWLRSTVGSGRLVVADRDTGTALGTVGDERVANGSLGFPVWDLYFSTKLPPPRLLTELRTSGYQFLIVDPQMYQSLPLTGAYFTSAEPDAGIRAQPPPRAALAKFSHLPWLTEIYSSKNIQIYRFDFTEVGACPDKAVLSTSLLPYCQRP
jgi:hypothetical protein